MTRVLVVGGHDPSGAGVDADRAALSDLDVEVLVVVTAHTDQDDHGVRSIGAVDARTWLAEALAHVQHGTDDRGVDAIKLGLLPGVEHVRAAVRLARAARAAHSEHSPGVGRSAMMHELDSAVFSIVLDPVIRASSGARFLDANAVEAMRGELIGEDVIVTPNIDELAELARVPAALLAASITARTHAAEMLLGLGARAVIAKGGHGLEDPVRDLVIERNGRVVTIEHARVVGGKIRGSGCRFAARLAGRMGESWPLEKAAKDASDHVSAAIERACRG
jgi:hydroxymethylpyrimidine/phosphomethylpyrimidine kinase